MKNLCFDTLFKMNFFLGSASCIFPSVFHHIPKLFLEIINFLSYLENHFWKILLLKFKIGQFLSIVCINGFSVTETDNVFVNT